MTILLKRAYDRPARSDGYRVLVDRIWPRGQNKDELQIDAWPKEIAPSTQLRKWFNHDPIKWTEFKRRYLRELTGKQEEVETLRKKAKRARVTLVFGAKDIDHNHALVLKTYLERCHK